MFSFVLIGQDTEQELSDIAISEVAESIPDLQKSVKEGPNTVNKICAVEAKINECEFFEEDISKSKESLAESIKCIKEQKKEVGLPSLVSHQELNILVKNEFKRNPNFYRYYAAKNVQDQMRGLLGRFGTKGRKKFSNLMKKFTEKSTYFLKTLEDYKKSRNNPVKTLFLAFKKKDKHMDINNVAHGQYLDSYYEIQNFIKNTKLLDHEKKEFKIRLRNLKKIADEKADKLHDATIKSLGSQIEIAQTVRDTAIISFVAVATGGASASISSIKNAHGLAKLSKGMKIAKALNVAAGTYATTQGIKIGASAIQSGLFASIQLLQGKDFFCEFAKNYNENFSDLNDDAVANFSEGVTKKVITAGFDEVIALDSEILEAYTTYKEVKSAIKKTEKVSALITGVADTSKKIADNYNSCFSDNEGLSQDLASVTVSLNKLRKTVPPIK